MTNYSLNFPLISHDMKLLHDFLSTASRVTLNFNNYVNSLDSMNNQLANLRNQKKILSATEITFDVLNLI